METYLEAQTSWDLSMLSGILTHDDYMFSSTLFSMLCRVDDETIQFTVYF